MKKEIPDFSMKLILLNISLILIQVVIIIFNINNYPAKVPLYFSRPWGNDQLAPVLFLFIIPLLSILFLLLGILSEKFLLKKEGSFFKYFCLVSPLAFAFLGLITIWKITILIA